MANYFSLSALLSAALLATLVAAAPSATVCSIFSRATGRFLKFSEDGKITADSFPTRNGNVIFHTLSDGQVRIELVKAGDACFVTYNADGEFAAAQPENDNDIFEKVLVRQIGSTKVFAFRAVNKQKLAEGASEGSAEASGSGAPEQTAEEGGEPATVAAEPIEDCYLGFRSSDSEAECFPSTEYAATLFSTFH